MARKMFPGFFDDTEFYGRRILNREPKKNLCLKNGKKGTKTR